jgi:hypothetical protein
MNLKDILDGVMEIPIKTTITEEITEGATTQEATVIITMMTAIESLMIYDKMKYFII